MAEQLTGWTQADARGRSVAEVFNIVHEETRVPAPIPVATVLATGEIQGLANHTALIARDGTERAIADSAAPIRDRGGRITGIAADASPVVVLVFRDVTATRRAQAELDRFFTLSLDFLCISAPDGYFKRVSPGVTEILGWSVEEFTSHALSATRPSRRHGRHGAGGGKAAARGPAGAEFREPLPPQGRLVARALVAFRAGSAHGA
ncbi:MAG: PAS domain S-box protein [Lacunisphaera sp.]